MKKNILITGGTGRLGAELKKHLVGHYLGKKNLDFTKPIKKKKYDLIIHAGAYTNVRKAEKEGAEECFRTNVYGTFNLVRSYKDVPFVFISSESAFKPEGIYPLSKKLGEEIVKTHPRHLILRTLFKPNPFPFAVAYKDQYTQGDYVDVIAKLLAQRVKNWDRKTCKLEYLGTGRKTMLELARRTRPDVVPNSIKDYFRKTGIRTPPEYK